MDSLIAVLFGVGIAGGLIITGRGLRRRPESLADILDSLEHSSNAGVESLSIEERFGRMNTGFARRMALASPTELRSRLRVVDKTMSRFAYEKLLAGVAAFTLPLIYLVMSGSFAELPSLPIAFIGFLAIVLAMAGFILPDLLLESEATERRAGFRRGLSGYLDVVSILIAGGGGIESALQYAADSGDGWAFDEIRSALASARVRQVSPWAAMQTLGDDLGVTELADLAASLALSGSQGARIRASLTAKADSLRSDEQNAIETAAEVKNQKMAVPMACLSLGLFLFIGYGALEAISSTPSDAAVTDTPQVAPLGADDVDG